MYISITMLQEKSKLINSMMEKEGIEYINYTEEIMETTKEKVDEILSHMKDRQLIMDKNNIANIKHMTWSTGNENAIKEEIEAWDKKK